MVNYIFAIGLEEEEPALLDDFPTRDQSEFRVEDTGDFPEGMESFLSEHYPEREFDSLLEKINALEPTKGILVHEYDSRARTAIGYHEDLTASQAKTLIQEIEDRLGYELEQQNKLESLSESEIKKHFPVPVGWDKENNPVVSKMERATGYLE